VERERETTGDWRTLSEPIDIIFLLVLLFFTQYIMNHIWMNDCAICRSKMKRNFVKTKCKHNFHTDCLKKWVRQGKNSCPMCRSNGITNVLLQNINTAKDDFVLKVKSFEKQFEKLDYKTIRTSFPMVMFPNEWITRYISANKYIIALLWVLLFDTTNKHKTFKESFIDLLKAHTKLENKLNGHLLRVWMNVNTNLATKISHLHKKSVAFFKFIYPFDMFADQSLVYNGKLHIPDYQFMKNIVKALQLHKIDEKEYNSYIKFLLSERKFYKQYS